MSDLARVLEAALDIQRQNHGWAKVANVAAATAMSETRVTRTFERAAERHMAKARKGGDAWTVTALGKQAIERGIVDGMPQRLADEDLRTRAWRAMRLQRKFTAESLLTIVLVAPADNYRSAYVRLQRYLCQLEAMRVVVCVARGRAHGKRYLLLEDLGQAAPVPLPASARLWDPNAERFVERPTAAELLSPSPAQVAA